jgi:hypothetical protein
MYWALFILVVLLLWNVQEPFTIKEVYEAPLIDIVKDYSIRPIYKGIVWMIPYKHHYRKVSRYLR